MKRTKLLKKVLASADNVRFGEFVQLAEAFGFEKQRTTGSHVIFAHPEMDELLNVQNYKGKAKAYQVRQFIKLLEKYGLDKEEA